MPTYKESAFFRNGEDIEFYDKEFQELAFQIIEGEHAFEREYTNLGWVNIFTTPIYRLEILFESNGRGSGKITYLS